MTATSGTGGGKMSRDSSGAAGRKVTVASTEASLAKNNGSSISALDKKEAKKLRSYESRKQRKPLMEKRRRMRINVCLETLKKILLEANKGTAAITTHKEGSRPGKLEKAEILERTVSLLLSLQPSSSGVKTSGNSEENSNPSSSATGDNSPAPNDVKQMEAVVEHKLAGGTAASIKSCHVKVSSSTCILSDSDDEHTPTTATAASTSTASSSASSLSSSSPPPPSCSPDPAHRIFLNGFTECLKMVKSSLKSSSKARNLEDTLECYLSELQEQILCHKSYYRHHHNNNSVGVRRDVDIRGEEYSPQHSPGAESTTSGIGSSSTGGDDLHMMMDVVDTTSVLSLENNNEYQQQQHKCNVASSSSPSILISSSASLKQFYNRPLHSHQKRYQGGHPLRYSVSKKQEHSGTYYVPRRLGNGEVDYVLKSEGGTGRYAPYDEQTRLNSPEEYHHYHQQQHPGRFDTPPHYLQPLIHSPTIEHLKTESAYSSPSHHHYYHSTRYFHHDIDSPRAVWRPW